MNLPPLQQYAIPPTWYPLACLTYAVLGVLYCRWLWCTMPPSLRGPLIGAAQRVTAFADRLRFSVIQALLPSTGWLLVRRQAQGQSPAGAEAAPAAPAGALLLQEPRPFCVEQPVYGFFTSSGGTSHCLLERHRPYVATYVGPVHIDFEHPTRPGVIVCLPLPTETAWANVLISPIEGEIYAAIFS